MKTKVGGEMGRGGGGGSGGSRVRGGGRSINHELNGSHNNAGDGTS